MLAVGKCGDDGHHVLCTAEPRISVDVEILRDIGDPALSATLEKGATQCASFDVMRPVMTAPLKAGRYTFEFSGIFLYQTGRDFALDCPLPAETTRLVVRLWEVTGSGSTPSLPWAVVIGDFPYSYRLEQK